MSPVYRLVTSRSVTGSLEMIHSQRMIFAKLKAGKSKTHGTGCFTVGPLKRGKVLTFWGDDREVQVLDGRKHKQSLRRGSRLTRETAVRLMGDWFVQSKKIADKDPTDYINHSDRPNVGYVGGLLFALRNIRRGEELFLDYRLLNAEYETNVVKGLGARPQLRAAARQVLKAFR